MVFLGSDLARVRIDVHAPVCLLAVQPFPLLEDDQRDARREDGGQRDQSRHEPRKAVGEDKADDGSPRRACRPIDVAALQPHQFQRPLQPLE